MAHLVAITYNVHRKKNARSLVWKDFLPEWFAFERMPEIIDEEELEELDGLIYEPEPETPDSWAIWKTIKSGFKAMGMKEKQDGRSSKTGG